MSYLFYLSSSCLLSSSFQNGAHICGLAYLSGQFLQASSGFITHIDYSTGELRVGGTVGSATTGVRVRLNDPGGRFGRSTAADASADTRFQVDEENPTIASASSYPMCIPRTDPAVADDPECPSRNRPLDPATGLPLQSFETVAPDLALAGAFPTPFRQAPMLVGDFINFAGTLAKSGPGTAGSEDVYVSAHTISSNTAIFTQPGTVPAYVSVEVTLMGVGGVTSVDGEATVRTRFEGSTTDSLAIIHLYGVDLNPNTSEASDRDWGTIGVDPGPPNGAVRGRWRYRPPCDTAIPTERDCTPPPGSSYLPPPRDVRAVIEGAITVPITDQFTAANGIVFGQYRAPIFEFIFAENRPGTPQVTNNFDSFPFLVNGGTQSSASTVIARQLNPWPGLTPPIPGPGGCVSPSAFAGGPYTVASGGSVTIIGTLRSGSDATPLWAVPAGGTSGAITPTNTATSTYFAPITTAPTIIVITFTLTNDCGSSSSTADVFVSGPTGPTVTPITPTVVLSGQAVTVDLVGTDPLNRQLTFSVVSADTPPSTVVVTVVSTGLLTARATFTAPALAANTVAPLTLTFNVVATSAGGSSPPAQLLVTVNPTPDTLLLVTEYRTGKQRLIISAASTNLSPNLQVTLLPYRTTLGSTFDPALLGAVFSNTGGGVHTITIVGALQPAAGPVLQAKTNAGGLSALTPVQRLRE